VAASGLVAAGGGAGAVNAGAAPDFDGDGFADLAVQVPGDDRPAVDAGSVQVLDGSADRLSAADDAIFRRAAAGTVGLAGDKFGFATAWGDFDGDGFDDLAVGVPFADPGGTSGAGAVDVFYGGSDGLDATTAEELLSSAFGDSIEPSDQYGAALAAGDFDGDGFADLAIGGRGEDIGSENAAGAVGILYGAPGGVGDGGNQLWDRNGTDVRSTALADDRFGYSLAPGDFDGDGRDDLAIGVPFNDFGNTSPLGAGSVHVLYASASGLSAGRDQLLFRDVAGVRGRSSPGDSFGQVLATGRFDAGKRWDLAVGVEHDDVKGIESAGSVHVFHGESDRGLGTSSDEIWHRDVAGVKRSAGAGDDFGDGLWPIASSPAADQ
jgi:hypothetical protein